MAEAPWHVLGAGSVGTLWACRLARAGLPVRVLWHDTARLARYQEGPGLRLIEAGVEQAFALPGEVPATAQPIARLLVTCKAYDAASAVAAVRHRLVSNTQVVALQNGLGSQQAVIAALPHAQVILASTTEGAFRRADGAVVSAGQGVTWLGGLGKQCAPAWLSELAQAGIPHQWTPDILARLWRKLAINCAINPLTVLHDCRNGVLVEHAEAVAGLCQELTLLLQGVGQPGAAVALLAEVQQVISATARNYSSMYQDVAAGRRTEIQYLIGHACAEAERCSVPVPRLDALRQALIARLRDKGLPTQ
jgi:2-dehydropantoate 2-reductase